MNLQQIKNFITAGNATFTLKSNKTEKHYTLRAIAVPERKGMYWISLLIGPNEYAYAGTLFGTAITDWKYVVTKRSPKGHHIHDVLHWFCRVINSGIIPETLEVYHEGRCGRCGRPLTTPESIDCGIGPVCAEKM